MCLWDTLLPNCPQTVPNAGYLAGDFLGRGMLDGSDPSSRRASSGSGGAQTGGGAARGQQDAGLLRNTMHVYIAAWLQAPELDERKAEQHLACIREDMRGF